MFIFCSLEVVLDGTSMGPFFLRRAAGAADDGACLLSGISLLGKAQEGTVRPPVHHSPPKKAHSQPPSGSQRAPGYTQGAQVPSTMRM